MKRFLLVAAVLLCACGAHADLIKQSTGYSRMVLMTQSADHITGATGLTLTVTASKNGAAFAAIGGAVTELSNGWYKIALNTTDTNTLGPLALHVTATGADPTDTLDQVVAFDPSSATNLGLSGLPTASPAAIGGLITIGTGSGQLNPNGSGGLPSLTTVSSGTAQAGAATTITLANTASATTDLYKGSYVLITSGTGAGQARTITAYNGGTFVATVSRAWTVNPDNTSVYAVIASPHPALNANLSVQLGGYDSGQDPATLLAAMVVDGTMTFKQLKTIEAAVNLEADRTWNATTHTAVLVYYRRAVSGTGADKTRPVLTKTTTYDSSNTQVVSQTITLSNLP